MIKKLTFAQIPQPIHNDSEMYATFDSGVTSIHSFPVDKRHISAKFSNRELKRSRNEKTYFTQTFQFMSNLLRTHTNNWARLFAFLSTSLWFTSVIAHDSDSSQFILCLLSLLASSRHDFNLYLTKTKIFLSISPENQNGFRSHVRF